MPLPFTPPLFDRFKDAILSLPEIPEYKRQHLCTAAFRLHSDTEVEMFFAPLDAVNRSAEIAVIGITPGFQQMEIAFRTARAALIAGARTAEDVCRHAKAAASFAGTMRLNLISMLADIGLHTALAIPTPALLFDNSGDHLVHTTSAIRYPVFVRGANYTGYRPRPLQHPLLRDMIFEVLAPELAEVPDALIIPLGKAVDECIAALISTGRLDRRRCLVGFPHASPGNGHRKRQFEQNRDELRAKTASWFVKKTVAATVSQS